LAQQVQHRDLLGHSERIVPRHDHCGRPKMHTRVQPGKIGHELQIVWTEGIVEEMMLRRPQHVKAALNGQTGQLEFLTPHLLIPDVLPAVAGEQHHHAHVYRLLL
jgi:hypothetical protein